MLYTEIEKMVAKTPLGDKQGTLDDMVIDGESWKVDKVVLSSGFIRRERTGVATSDVKLDQENAKMVISPDVDQSEMDDELTTINNMLYSDLRKKDVLTSDGEKAGSIYDLEIYTELKRWEVAKFLIDTGWTSRRLRIGPDKLEKVGEDIHLKISKEDIEKLTRPELEGEAESE